MFSASTTVTTEHNKNEYVHIFNVIAIKRNFFFVRSICEENRTAHKSIDRYEHVMTTDNTIVWVAVQDQFFLSNIKQRLDCFYTFKFLLSLHKGV